MIFTSTKCHKKTPEPSAHGTHFTLHSSPSADLAAEAQLPPTLGAQKSSTLWRPRRGEPPLPIALALQALAVALAPCFGCGAEVTSTDEKSGPGKSTSETGGVQWENPMEMEVSIGKSHGNGGL